jgi:hypothetical protein
MQCIERLQGYEADRKSMRPKTTCGVLIRVFYLRPPMLIVEAYLNTLHICRIGTNASLHKIPVCMP